MVYLIGHNDSKFTELKLLLENGNLDFKLTDWSHIYNSPPNLHIIYEPEESYLSRERLKLLQESRAPIIGLFNLTEGVVINNDNILILPYNTNITALKSLINWIISKTTAGICQDLLKSFFYNNEYHIFFLDKEERILYSVPEKKSFLVSDSKSFQKESFKKIFGISVIDIPSITDSDEEQLYTIVVETKKIKVNLLKIAYSESKIPGAPKNTETILFINLRDSHEVIKDNEVNKKSKTVFLKQKAVELLIANEIHQRQTGALKAAYDQLDFRNKQILEELTLASDLQKNLLPRDFPSDMPLNFTHKYLPHTYIGGDFFDIMRLDQNNLGIIIADVSGHGVAAAFITAMFKTAFTHYGENEFSPARVLELLNKEFAATLHTEHYITAFYAILDTKEMKCTYCNAGHPKQLLFKTSGEVQELTSDGFFIGMFDNTVYKDEEIPLCPGDRLVLYTDGIVEVSDAQQILYGRENLIKLINKHKDDNIESISNKLMTSLVMYMDDINFKDDLTILFAEIETPAK